MPDSTQECLSGCADGHESEPCTLSRSWDRGCVRMHAVQEVDVFVRDTGIGIPEDKFDQIFQAFEQVSWACTIWYCCARSQAGVRAQGCPCKN